MPEPHPQAPSIAPVSAGIPRPRWSVMLPVCNRLATLEQALRSVLAQDRGAEAMQIEVVDNSTDELDVAGFVRKVAGERAGYFRQPVHLGLAENWTTCIERARGELVHMLHDDDYLGAGFYDSMERAAAGQPGVGVFVCRCFIVDDDGAIDLLSDRIRGLEANPPDITPLFYGNPIRCPGVVVRRSAYEACGGFRAGLAHTADWEMWVRALHRCGGTFINQPLACYRLSAAGLSLDPRKAIDNLQDFLRLAGLFEAGYPQFDRARFLREWTGMVLSRALEAEEGGQTELARATFRLWYRFSTFGQKLIALGKACVRRDPRFFHLATRLRGFRPEPR